MSDDENQSMGDDFLEDQTSDAHSSGSDRSTYHESSTKKDVMFNEYGQPVGLGSEKFSTAVGKIAKAHCPPAIKSWKNVSSTIKNTIWNNVTYEYSVPEVYRKKVLRKANIAWKNWKSSLRKKYDKHKTDVDRKKNRPRGMKKEDWEEFIVFCSTKADKGRREKGRKARGCAKRLHSSGRTGCARIAHKMKEESLTGDINRTELYLITHVRKVGSTSMSTSEGLDQIRKLVADDPYLGHKDLDHDAVAMVCGPDGKGYVRGMGGGVTKTEIRASGPSREIARKEKKQHEVINNEIIILREEVATLKQLVQSNATKPPQSQEFRDTSQGGESDLTTRTCFLKNLRRKVIAYGRLNTEAPPNKEA
ncbi:unnamed protein product [Cuscuta epithymum]|uniref:Transposase, Ptta/En/Spm, plant n=1 Tax=Cuscuta epithymum TaxID=186058 RepID=A0AAV0EYK9_9ASTE|nr:unnamed protein product [Cuscuta epithymum]